MELEWKWISTVEIGLKEVALISHHKIIPTSSYSKVETGGMDYQEETAKMVN